MKVRAAIITGVVLAAGVAGVSQAAAPKKVCKLLIDATGDGEFLVPGNDASLDIVSADIASSTKTITGVIRVSKYAATDVGAPMGRVWYVQFVAPGYTKPLWMSVGIDPVLGATYEYGFLDTLASGNGSYEAIDGAPAATGKIDVAKNELRVHVPVAGYALLKANVKPGAVFKSMTSTSTALIGVLGGGVVATVDEATTKKTYKAGAPSCVAVGK